MRTGMPEPLCPYFGKCGGCSSQHISYENQLKQKQEIVANRIGMKAGDIEVYSDKEYHYRNRMDFIFHSSHSSGVSSGISSGIGLREKGDWKSVVDIKKCVISNDKLNVLLEELRENFNNIDAFDVRKHSGTYRYAVIRASGNGASVSSGPSSNGSSISFVLNEDSSKTGDAIAKIKVYAKISKAENIVVTYVPSHTDISISDEYFVVKGTDILKETLLDKEFSFNVQGFFQNNSEMANKIHGYVNKICSSQPKGLSLLDLYAGVGTFGINNAAYFYKVFIIESDKHCVDAAKINIENNKVMNSELVMLDAMQLKKIELPSKLFVITDPPRSGMHPKTIEQLKGLKPKAMIYISCNVEQLGKDLQKFPEYALKKTAMFDLFPQTPHIEAIAYLELKVG